MLYYNIDLGLKNNVTAQGRIQDFGQRGAIISGVARIFFAYLTIVEKLLINN